MSPISKCSVNTSVHCSTGLGLVGGETGRNWEKLEETFTFRVIGGTQRLCQSPASRKKKGGKQSAAK